MTGPEDLDGALELLTPAQQRLVALAPHAFTLSTDAELAKEAQEASTLALAARDAAQTAEGEEATLDALRQALLAGFALHAIAAEAARRAGVARDAPSARTRH